MKGTRSISTRTGGNGRPPRMTATYPRGGMHQATWLNSGISGTATRFTTDRLEPETRINISTNEDLLEARRTGRLLVQNMGFSGSRVTLVTTVISELARNILLYARAGEIVLSRLDGGAKLNVTAFDQGPGIENLPGVLSGGYSTSGGLGLGLSGLRRIADKFEINTQLGKGTQVSVSIHA